MSQGPKQGTRDWARYRQSQGIIWRICVLCTHSPGGFKCTPSAFLGNPTLHPLRLCPCPQHPHGIQERRIIPAAGPGALLQGKDLRNREGWSPGTNWRHFANAGRSYWSRGHAVALALGRHLTGATGVYAISPHCYPGHWHTRRPWICGPCRCRSTPPTPLLALGGLTPPQFWYYPPAPGRAPGQRHHCPVTLSWE